jgi:metal-responsive CopG/Arc/MetJ family transcriptional regulator
MSAKVINISLPEDLLREIDEAARSDSRTRSEFLREAARTYMENRRWKSIRGWGTRTAQEMGLTEDDVERLVHEYREGAA